MFRVTTKSNNVYIGNIVDETSEHICIVPRGKTEPVTIMRHAIFRIDEHDEYPTCYMVPLWAVVCDSDHETWAPKHFNKYTIAQQCAHILTQQAEQCGSPVKYRVDIAYFTDLLVDDVEN